MQLYGEIARGSWGVSRATIDHVVPADPTELWQVLQSDPSTLFAATPDVYS
eukprot:SAG31_NODE_4209_length_3471_cov_1.290629_2_plen_51_part_00